MRGIVLKERDAVMMFFALLMLIALAAGFGYFFGRYEQIIINKSLLQEIPDVNCGSENEGL